MSESIKAIIVGIIQGLTEFLPVSSSGHIEISKVIIGLKFNEEENLLFTLVLHLATACSTIIIFRKDIMQILSDVFQLKRTGLLFAAKIILSMIPAALVGVLLKDEIESLFSGNLLLVGPMLILTGVLLYVADKKTENKRKVSFTDAFIIGAAQAIAILPGISRSGATIATSVIIGNEKSIAARFSFLMVIPLIFGAFAKDFLDGGFNQVISTSDIQNMVLGFVAAFISGCLACSLMIQLVKKAKLYWFSIYCFIVGFSVIGYHFLVYK